MSNQTPAEQAAAWVLRLQDASANAETFMDWQRWLAASPENMLAYHEIEETLLSLSRLEERPQLPDAAEMDADRYDGTVAVGKFLASRSNARQPQRAARRLRWSAVARYSMAASVAAVMLVGGWLGYDLFRESRRGAFAYATAPGQQNSITLPDGSSVTLDADSALNVELTRSGRSLRLVRGEAFFDVARDPKRPFIVSAGGARVRAVGTEFNVRMGGHRTVVAVIEGVVQVAARTNGSTGTAGSGEVLPGAADEFVTEIRAGQGVAYAGDQGMQALSQSEAELATSWLQGRRQYRNEELQYVLADVDRYTGLQIELADAATGALKFTGTLNLKNSDAWLRGLSIALPVTVTRRADGVLLVSLKPTTLEQTRPKPAATRTTQRATPKSGRRHA